MYGQGLFRSQDSGKSWHKISGLGYPENRHFLRVRVEKKSGDVFVAVTGIQRGLDFYHSGGLWRSQDGGADMA